MDLIFLIIGWTFFLSTSFGILKIIQERTLQKYPVDPKKPIISAGVLFYDKDNYQEAVIKLDPSGCIDIVNKNGLIKKINRASIRRTKFSVTASLATSHFYISTQEGVDFLFFNDVNHESLIAKINTILLDNTTGTGLLSGVKVLDDSVSRAKNKPYYTSDEHSELHNWLIKTKFPGYHSVFKLVPSDLIGLIIILTFPSMIIFGITFELLSSILFDSKEIGTAIFGWIIILIVLSYSIYSITSSLKLKQKIEKSRKLIGLK
jgi:hypothetical protein